MSRRRPPMFREGRSSVFDTVPPACDDLPCALVRFQSDVSICAVVSIWTLTCGAWDDGSSIRRVISTLGPGKYLECEMPQSWSGAVEETLLQRLCGRPTANASRS